MQFPLELFSLFDGCLLLLLTSQHFLLHLLQFLDQVLLILFIEGLLLLSLLNGL